jgi:hypothetical protein
MHGIINRCLFALYKHEIWREPNLMTIPNNSSEVFQNRTRYEIFSHLKLDQKTNTTKKSVVSFSNALFQTGKQTKWFHFNKIFKQQKCLD